MRIFLAYGAADQGSAGPLIDRLHSEPDLEVTSDAVEIFNYAARGSFAHSIRNHDAVVHLISLNFLQSDNCMNALLAFMEHDAARNEYLERTVPLVIPDPSAEIDLFAREGQAEVKTLWVARAHALESELNQALENELNARRDSEVAIATLRSDLTVRRSIAEHIDRFLRTVTDNVLAMEYSAAAADGFDVVVTHLREMVASGSTRNASAHRKAKPRPAGSDVALDGISQDILRLTELHDSIQVASDSDPERPEFPPFSPRFPATPHYELEVPRLSRSVMIKDESFNFTGSHKDRMAWEIVVYYKRIIEDLLAPQAKHPPVVPAASIISNGSAAFAIQVMFRCFSLPPLKVLVDQSTSDPIVNKLRRIGCEVYRAKLSEKELDSEEILRLTDNIDGFDVTARRLIDPTRRTYYDWLAYEILNCGAKHIFIPVGTGDLYVNVLTVLRDEITGVANDRRLRGGVSSIEDVEVYGATSKDRKTKMDKLYAAHRPTLREADQVVTELREAGVCGPNSRIYEVAENRARDAVRLARANDINSDESGIAGLALLMQLSYVRAFPPNEPILVVNTGWLSLP